jgi:Ca2+-dependent lipid-binding protein
MQNPEVLYLTIIRAEHLIPRDVKTSDPYVDIAAEDRKAIAKSKTIDSNLNPKWDEQFVFEVPINVRYLTFTVWDSDNIGNDDFLGAAILGILPRVSSKHLLTLGARRGNQDDEKLLKKHKNDLGKLEVSLEWRIKTDANVHLRRLACE